MSDRTVVRSVAVVDDKLLRGSKVTFDAVHPRCVGHDEDKFDVVCIRPVNDLLLFVGREVVRDDVESSFAGISSSDRFEKLKNLLPSLLFLVMHPKAVFVNIVGYQEMTDSLGAKIDGSLSNRGVLGSPRTSRLRLYLNGSKLVDNRLLTISSVPFRRGLGRVF